MTKDNLIKLIVSCEDAVVVINDNDKNNWQLQDAKNESIICTAKNSNIDRGVIYDIVNILNERLLEKPVKIIWKN